MPGEIETDIQISKGVPARATREFICCITLDTVSDSSVSSEELLDEDDHLGLLDGAGVVLVEG